MQREAKRIDFELPNEEVVTGKVATEDVETEADKADVTAEDDEVAEAEVYNATLTSDPGTPASYREALAGADSKKWHEALVAELNNFTKRGSWAMIERTIVAEKKRKIIPQKWELRKKNEQDGSIRYKLQSVTKGYMQVPGIDFTELFSQEDWICEVFDVEAAFLNADNDIKMYAEWLEGSVELGYLTEESHDKFKATMHDMAVTIVEDYVKHIGHPIKDARTPGFPGTTLTKGEDEAERISTERYRSLVGKIMYYTTKIAPDCASAARELSQFMARPTQKHWNTMERLVAYIKEKKSHHLVYRKPRELRVIGAADANYYATNADDRKSVFGSIHTVGGMQTSWSSRTQMDVRMNWIRNVVDAGRVIFLFMKSEEMPADGMTKNVPERLFQYHVPDMLNGTMRSWREDVKMSGLSSNQGAVTPAITDRDKRASDEWKRVKRRNPSNQD
jgi:hypothetical protein